MVKKLAGKDAAARPGPGPGDAGHARRARRLAVAAVLGLPRVSWSTANFGLSYTYFPFKVTEVIGQAFWWTVVLVTVTQVLSFVVGVVLGAYAAWRRNSPLRLGRDARARRSSARCSPFWIALLLLYVFGYSLGWFPTSGGYEESTPGFNWPFIQEAVSHAFLPAVALLIVTPIGWILGMRNTMIMNLGEDYIRLAKAKGLPDRTSRWSMRPATRCCPASPASPSRSVACSVARSSSRRSSTTPDWAGSWARPSRNKDYPLLQALMLLRPSACSSPTSSPTCCTACSTREPGGQEDDCHNTPVPSPGELHGRGRPGAGGRPSSRSATSRRPDRGGRSSGAAGRRGSASSSSRSTSLVGDLRARSSRRTTRSTARFPPLAGPSVDQLARHDDRAARTSRPS